MIAFIDRHKDRFRGRADLSRPADRPVHLPRCRSPTRLGSSCPRCELKAEIARIHAEHFGVYGARKVWRQLHREGITVARGTVERLMGELGLGGVGRGKPRRTTTPDAAATPRADLVERDFSATRPNQLWVADLT